MIAGTYGSRSSSSRFRGLTLPQDTEAVYVVESSGNAATAQLEVKTVSLYHGSCCLLAPAGSAEGAGAPADGPFSFSLSSHELFSQAKLSSARVPGKHTAL